MCCFSQPVKSVSATNIFARAGDEGRQFLVYSMSLDARKDLAMILPLPVKTPAGEKDVQFIDLKGYQDFFADLLSGFPVPHAKDSRGLIHLGLETAAASKLEVVQVGDFEASFVPDVKDFSRLDERFRLPADAWKKLPDYETWGFAVFKLKPGAMTVHPMAFSFLRRDANTLFFPTVHIHDGKVHPKADFDHTLYCQPHQDHHLALGRAWKESDGPANRFVQVDKTKGVIEADQHCYQCKLHGQLPNRDTILKIG
jgi:hypothetical protein